MMKDPEAVRVFDELWNGIPLRDRLESGQTYEKQLEWSVPTLERMKEGSAATWDDVLSALKGVMGKKASRNISYWIQDSADEITRKLRRDREDFERWFSNSALFRSVPLGTVG